MKNLKEWEHKVSEYLIELNDKLLENDYTKSIYYGFDIIDGKLINSPEILFIGINPGKGSGKRHYQVKINSDRISYLDYFDQEYKYHLAEQTVEVLRLVGFSDEEIVNKLESQCVKTNLYHVITDTDKEIAKTMNSIENYSFQEYYKTSVEFCVDLIKLLKPKIVIFEGKNPYDQIVEVCYEAKNTWDKELKIGYFRSQIDNINFVGYTRTYSTINNKEDLAFMLKRLLLN